MGVGRLRGKTKRGCGKDLESFDPHQEVEFPESRDVRRLLKVGCSRAKNKSGETGMKGDSRSVERDGISRAQSWDGRRGSSKQAAAGKQSPV